MRPFFAILKELLKDADQNGNITEIQIICMNLSAARVQLNAKRSAFSANIPRMKGIYVGEKESYGK